ncbi:ROK family protein [Arthrobacter sp. YN]|uniref:ROK family protein n=1 Tax=Arthrobacter sp. YN TaxID=2020486 RepID=UPI000B5E3A5B|nr:ROK family protein [Arthrobacter sp. YN]ASN22352.1 sugar kinase [Arthrobacter sp. YN]
MNHVIGVDLGGTKTAAGVVTPSGDVLMSETIPTLNRAGGEAILDATAALIGGLVERAADAGMSVSGVGIGSAGVIDAVVGSVVSATDAILDWAGTELVAGLSSRLGFGTVRAVNDVHAHALGEAWLGAAAGSSSSLMVAFGTGVGGSLVLAGTPVLGHRFVGGHVGHFASPYASFGGSPLSCVCGGSGHVEAVASGPALHEAFLRFGGSAVDAADTRGVFALATSVSDAHDGGAAAGSADSRTAALHAIELGAAAAGQAVGGLINILDPETVVISGGLADAGEIWWKPMEAALRRELLAPLVAIPVLRATLGNTAAIVGAAKLVLK